MSKAAARFDGGVDPPEVAEAGRTLLASVRERVAARAAELVTAPGLESSVAVDARLAELEHRVGQALDGEGLDALRAWVASTPGASTLVRVLAHELARDPIAEPGGAAAALAALRTLIAASGDPLDAHHAESGGLVAAMHGPDAFDLLVEVVHDFRSPLTSILFLSEALRNGHSGPVNETQRSQLGLMYGAAFELTSIASDIVDLARRRMDLTDDEAELFSVPELLSSVGRMVRPMVEEKSLELRIVAPERARAHGQVHALSRVLLNLTTNALKFTEAGYVELGARSASSGRLEFHVRDTGRGIPPERQKELFEPFQQRLGGSKGGLRFSGSGVGLSIARRLLRSMGSELRLDSSDENGTRFSFMIPSRNAD